MAKTQTMARPIVRPSKDHDYGRFDFIGLAKFLVPLSLLSVAAAFVCMLTLGFNYGVDFAGGTEVQIGFNKLIEPGVVRKFATDMGFPGASVQAFQGGKEFLIRIDPPVGISDKEINEALKNQIQTITAGLGKSFVTEEPSVLRVDTVGPQVGSDLKRNGILAAFYSILMILIYVGLRFDYKYSPGAVFCLFHDAMVILGVYSIFRFEMNVQIMAAILTIIGYSMNDTIVVFDRIRENVKLYRDKPFRWICNRSMNDVLVRSLLTSLTTFISVMIMYFLAGGVIRDFALTMAIGIVIGTYSTVYVATPFVIWIDDMEHNKKKKA